MLSLIITALLGIAAIAIFFYIAERSRQSRFAQSHGCQLPPKRKTWDPILGLHYKIQDFNSMSKYRILPDGLTLYHQYGPTYREPSIFGTTIKSIDEENIRIVYGPDSQKWGIQPARLTGMRPFCGEGILTTDGLVWKRSRSLFKPAFQKGTISDLTAFKQLAEAFLVRLPRDESVINLQDSISILFADTSAQFAMGQSLGLLDGTHLEGVPDGGQSFLNAFQRSVAGCGLRIFLGMFRVLLPKSMTIIHWEVVHKVVTNNIDRVLREDAAKLAKNPKSLLDELVRQTKDQTELQNHTIQGLMASLDTTAVLISNTMFLLSRNPVFWDRLRADIAGVDSRILEVEDMKKVELVRNILNESLRLYPVFPLLARDALEDTILPAGGGTSGDKPMFAPKGTRFLADFYALHREETVFGPNVEKFDPDRWQSIHPGQWQYMAFGGGARSCLGQQKAIAEASYILIRMAQIFKSIESRDSEDYAGEVQLLVKNHNGCKIALIPA